MNDAHLFVCARPRRLARPPAVRQHVFRTHLRHAAGIRTCRQFEPDGARRFPAASASGGWARRPSLTRASPPSSRATAAHLRCAPTEGWRGRERWLISLRLIARHLHREKRVGPTIHPAQETSERASVYSCLLLCAMYQGSCLKFRLNFSGAQNVHDILQISLPRI